MDKSKFPGLLAELMQEKQINQFNLAQKLGVRQSQVSNWLNGKTKPNYDSIKMLCDFFNVSADLIIDTKFGG